jgi:hypothetical protein
VTPARWRGLVALAADAVEHGSRAVERIQKETARRPIALVARVAPLAPIAAAVGAAHEAGVSWVHGGIRLAARIASRAAELALADRDGVGGDRP